MHRLILALPLLVLGCVEPKPEGSFTDCAGTDPSGVSVQTASMDGDDLVLDVNYGGCGSVEFEICWPDQAFMESEPVQVSLALWHEDPGDCDMDINETIRFDATPLRNAYESAYPGGSGLISIGDVVKARLSELAMEKNALEDMIKGF